MLNSSYYIMRFVFCFELFSEINWCFFAMVICRFIIKLFDFFCYCHTFLSRYQFRNRKKWYYYWNVWCILSKQIKNTKICVYIRIVCVEKKCGIQHNFFSEIIIIMISNTIYRFFKSLR